MYCRLLLIYTRCDCNEWRTEKRHECANMGKVKRLKLWWQMYRTSLPVWDLENFRPMDFCWHECTYDATLRHIRVSIVSAESSKYYTFWVCVCSLRYSARQGYARYYIGNCDLSGSTIFLHIIGVYFRTFCTKFLLLSFWWIDIYYF